MITDDAHALLDVNQVAQRLNMRTKNEESIYVTLTSLGPPIQLCRNDINETRDTKNRVMARRKTKLTMSESIRQALVDSEYSLNAIAGETGVSQPQLSRFVNGDRGLSVGSLDTLCEFLGLELRPAEKRKKN